MVEHRVRFRWLYADAVITAGVTVDTKSTQPPVSILVLVEEDARGAETVHKRTFATSAVGVGEQMQRL